MYADEIVENAWMRSYATCECARSGHHHAGPCGAPLVWVQRGIPNGIGGWEVRRGRDRTLGGWEAVNQCEILCWACYQAVTAARLTASSAPLENAEAGHVRGARSLTRR